MAIARVAAAQAGDATSTDQPVGSDKASPSEAKRAAQTKRALGRDNPRATMATFLSAIDEAEQGRIERYADALACLDLSGLSDLPDDARNSQGRKLASLLNQFIDRHGIDLELIPEDSDGAPYSYFDDPDGTNAIQIKRYDDGVWLFTWASLALVQDPPPETSRDGSSPGAKPSPPTEPPQSEQRPAQGPQLVPTEFRSARAAMRTFRDAMKAGRFDDAAQCLDLSDFPQAIRGAKGAELALYLFESIRRTKVLVLLEFNEDPAGAPHIFRQDEFGAIVIARQDEDDKRSGYWLFDKQTVAGAKDLYDKLLESGAQVKSQDQTAQTAVTLFLKLRNHIPKSLKETWFLLEHWQWLALVVLFILGRLVQRLTVFLLRSVTTLWLKRRGVTVAETVLVAPIRPAGILAAAAVWWIGLTWLALRPDVLTVLLIAVKFITCWAAVWIVYRTVDLLADYFASLAAKTTTKVDDLLVPFARKAAKMLVTVFGILFIVEQFTVETPIKLLAGLGLGGLALALAAQDTLKNLFGSLAVVADRPFEVGDWVVIGDVEGTVESVGFRSTRIRTFYNSRVTVPNATLMNATIDNYGARQYRRIKVMLSITYATPPEKIDAFCEGIRELIRLHPYTRKDYYHVYFNQFAASSLDILLYVFLEVPDFGTELRERHRLFIDILRLADRLGVEFAFPTQTLWLQRSREEAERVFIAPGQDDPHAVGMDEAAKLYEQAYGVSPASRAPVVIETAPRSKRRSQSGSDDGTTKT